MGFVIFLIILILLWVLLKPLIVRKAQEHAADYFARKINEQFRRQAEENGHIDPFSTIFTNMGFGGYAPGSDPRNQGAQPRQRRKRFTRDMGEYVEFEELEGKVTYTETSYHEPAGKPEPRITDAEWEDIR